MDIKKIIIATIMMFFFNQIVNAQRISSTQFNSSTRNTAMGNSNISEIFDVNSMYENPSTIVYMKYQNVAMNHTNLRNGNGMLENIAFPVLPSGPVMIAFGLDLFHIGYISNKYVANRQRVHILEFGYDIAGAYAITTTFSLGASASIRLGKTNDSEKWTGFYSVGADYFPSADISYGIVLNGLGEGLNYSEENSQLRVDRFNLPRSLEIGATMRYPSSSSLRRPYFKLSIANEKVLDKSGLYYKGGMQLSPFYFLDIRFGYLVGPGLSETRFGFGFKMENVDFGFTYYPHESSSVLHQFSLSINI